MTAQFNSLSQCVAYYHNRIDQLFQLHQEALIEKNQPLAQEAFKQLRKFLEAHIALENELLFPPHRQLDITPLWKTLIYEEEHKKLRQLIDKTQAMLNKPMGDDKIRHWVIEVMDYERTLKNLLEHHEEREEKGLLPELDNHLSAQQTTALITQCHLAWQESYDNLHEQIAHIRSQL